MRLNGGFTLIEMVIYLSIVTIGLSVGFLLYGAERMTRQTQGRVFRENAAVSQTLCEIAEDIRDCVRAIPRRRGAGAVFFFADGSTAVWFGRDEEPGVVHRRLIRSGGRADPDRVVARGVDRLGIEMEGRLVTATVASGAEERSLTVRRRR